MNIGRKSHCSDALWSYFMQKIRNIHSRYVQSSRHTACSSVGKLSAAVINNRMKFSG